MRQVWIGTVALGLALALSACGGGDTTQGSAAATGEVNLKNASLEEVQKQAQAAGGAAAKLQPGQWETKVEISDIDMPGVPPAMAKTLGETMKGAAATTVTNCITPEEAARPQGKVFGGGNSDQCRYEKFTMGGGRMEGTLVCKDADRGGSMTMTTNGTFTATSFAIDNDMKMEGGPQAMTMKARVNGKRLGECPK